MAGPDTLFQPRVVDALPAIPPAYSLLVAADQLDDGVDWYGGIAWRPEQIHGGGTAGLECVDPEAELGTTPVVPPTQSAAPFVVWAEDHCTTLTGSKAFLEYEARARRQLAAVQSYYIANEFQLGTLRDSLGLPNVALVDATELTSPGDPLGCLAALEEEIAILFNGRRCMIHMSPQILTLLHASNTLIRAGQKWLTPQGNVVVSDAGYSPESGNIFMYATGMVYVRLGDVDVPATWGDGLGFLDYTTNDVRIYAQREALVQVDGTYGATEDAIGDAMFKIKVDDVSFPTPIA